MEKTVVYIMDGMSEDSMSRRDFLKKAGFVTGAVFAGVWGVDKVLGKLHELPNSSKIEPTPTAELSILTPDVVNGVEVYGLKEKINSVGMIDRFYAFLDEQFATNNNIRIKNTPEGKIKQRKELLNPNERYLEVVVRRSAYDSFTRKQMETGVNFPEWIKVHVDVMNRCLEAAKPSLKMKAVLRRIIIIGDDVVKDFWDEKAYKDGNGEALDAEWFRRYTPFSFDTDTSWAIADDYRTSGGGNFWEIRHKDGKTIIGTPTGAEVFEQFFEFPEKNDSLSGKNNVSFDMGIDHELVHRLLNLPDEYSQDVHDASQRFKDFTFGGGSFELPHFSAYLSYLMTENIRLRARNYFTVDDRTSVCFSEHPNKIEIVAQLQNQDVNNGKIEASRVRLVDGSFYGNKKVPQNMDRNSETNSLDFDYKLFQDNSNCWLIRMIEGDLTREVFLPAAAFNMSKIAGLDTVKYNLTFSGYENFVRTKQEVMLIDETEIDEYLKNSKDPYYAKMKVEGTNIWFVWFLRA